MHLRDLYHPIRTRVSTGIEATYLLPNTCVQVVSGAPKH